MVSKKTAIEFADKVAEDYANSDFVKIEHWRELIKIMKASRDLPCSESANEILKRLGLT